MNGQRPSRWSSLWLWIGLSCGVIVVGTGGLVATFAYLSYQSLQWVRHEPLLATATAMAMKDPNVKVIARDAERHRITLRNQETGERFVLAAAEDRLTIQAGADQVDFLSVQSLGGELRLGKAAGPPPAWVAVDPGLPLHTVFVSFAGGVESGCAVVLTEVPLQEIYRRYEEAFARPGFVVLHSGGALSASSPDSRLSVFLSPSPHNPRRAVLNWSELVGESAEEQLR